METFETDEFRIERISHDQLRSQERRSDGLAPMPIQGAIRSAEVTCKRCGDTWDARAGDGTLYVSFGSVSVICPTCERSGAVPTR